jgi:hypothetical protein
VAQTPEVKVKNKVVAQLKELGAYYFYPVTGGYGSSGVFDIVVCYKGLFIGIECKADARKRGPTKLQSVNARHAKTSGAIVLILDAHNCEQLEKILGSLEVSAHDSSERSDRFSVWPFDGVTS